MNVSDLVKFNREKFYNGAVQTEWFYDDAKVAGIAGSYVFHGPTYYGVSNEDVKPGEHKLLDTASYVQKIADKVSAKKAGNDFILTIARYGTGKSHLAVTIGALLSGESITQKVILDNIASVDKDIVFDIEGKIKQKNLIIALNGMKNFNLDSEVLRCVRESLKKEGVDDSILHSITKTYDIAKYFIESNYESCSSDFIKAAKKSQIEIDEKKLKEYLLKNIESDNHVIDAVNIVFKKMTGDSLHWEQGISAGEIISKVGQELCGEGKPFNKLVILFDEFGRYIEYVAANPAVAGDASLQQIFEAIQSANGTALFIGFIQYELEAYLSHIDKASNVIRYVGRYSTSEKYYLSSNFETILANLLQKNEDGSFEKNIGRALTKYKSFYDRMHSAMLRWSDGKNQKNVWISDALYKKVIMEGCFPLHPLTVWILSNSEGWMQQRSAISFCAEMYEDVSQNEIEGDWLPYVYPVDIIDSGIFAEMLNSEEEGRVKSQNCMLYNEICAKIGDKLSYEEQQILKAVLVTRIVGFKFFDKEDAYVAFRYCTNLKEEQIKPIVKNLEDRHGVISYDDQANSYDLIAEANGFNEFKRIYVRYKTGVKADIEDADEEMLANIKINEPIETSFAQENHISSNEWKFGKRLVNAFSIDESYLNSLIRTLDSAYDGDSYRGMVLYAYCSEDSDEEIQRLSDICARLNLEETPILILFLDDPDGEILSSMTVKNIIKRFSVADTERFAKHIAAQNRGKDKKINQKFSSMVMERKRIAPGGLITYNLRLNALCSERFAKVYKNPVPFMFDGFESSKAAQAKKTLINLCIKMFDHSLMNVQSYQALSTQDKNRVKACLSTGLKSIDGSKFQADNSKDKNFTKNKLDDRIRWLNAHTDEYLRILDEMDEADGEGAEPDRMTREMVEEKLKEARERLERYEAYQKFMEETGASQLSLTDADAKLMKSKNGFVVGYNPQTAVDSETHLIRDFNMTNQVTDHGQMASTMAGIRGENPEGVIEAVADKGYQHEEDMIRCLENGIIPHVITEDGRDGFELELEYWEAE